MKICNFYFTQAIVIALNLFLGCAKQLLACGYGTLGKGFFLGRIRLKDINTGISVTFHTNGKLYDRLT